MAMEVILLENVEGLGRKGDRVKVSLGFGRNHLLPYHKAIAATPDALSRLDTMKKKFAVEEAKIVAELKGVAGKLEGLKITLTMRATPEGHLFGSVSAHMLATAMKERGHDVAERDVRIKEPIKEVGTYTVGVHLHADVKVEITVVVEAEGKPEEPPAAETTAAAPEAAVAAAAPAPSTPPAE
jgi:large subunit ribosomal protein L9